MSAIAEIISLLPLTTLRLTAAADGLHESQGLSAAKRSVLVGAAATGPRSVSDMAAHRRVSRQYIQRLVDELVASGLLKAQPNPRHRRSPLIGLTPRGAQSVRAIRAAEAPHLKRLAAGLSAADLEATARVLSALSEKLAPAREEAFS
jgi:DNA-binding MarR family transcriptional regulator